MGTKEYHCRTASLCAEWDEDDDMFLIYFLTKLLLCVRYQVMWVGVEEYTIIKSVFSS